jgi:hypothetical protein
MTATFNLNKTNIITRALQAINVIDLNATPDYDEYAYASDVLNLMIKKWEAMGMNLWKRRIGYLFTAKDTASYSLGSAGTYATNSYVSTTISAAEASGQTTISVTSSSGMSASDYIGIELDSGSRFWSTISSVPSSTSVIINDALTGAAAADNTVVTFTTKITRPLRIIRATCMDLGNSNTESAMSMIGHDEYFDIPVKSSSGKPNQLYYDKLLSGSTPYTGTAYLFPRPSDVNNVIVFSYQESLADITNTTDYADFPQEWVYALIVNLACELAYHYGKYEELQMLQPKADKELAIVQRFDSDDAPINISFG